MFGHSAGLYPLSPAGESENAEKDIFVASFKNVDSRGSSKQRSLAQRQSNRQRRLVPRNEHNDHVLRSHPLSVDAIHTHGN